jgi:hypothetical protein
MSIRGSYRQLGVTINQGYRYLREVTTTKWSQPHYNFLFFIIYIVFKPVFLIFR